MEPWLRDVLTDLAHLDCAADLRVFGSLAAGATAPRDADVGLVVETRWLHLGSDRATRQAMDDLLTLARRHYGRLDPFIRLSDALLTRDAEARAWIRAARKTRADLEAAIRAGRPLAEFLPASP